MRSRLGLVLVGCTILAIQALLTAAWNRPEYLPPIPHLSSLPAVIGVWHATSEPALDPAALSMLSPDDVLNRMYTDERATDASLFIVYYRSQHRAKQAHDPKVCLPGSGWIPIHSETIQIPIPQLTKMLPANYYVIKNGTATDIAIYWFQTVNGPTAATESVRFSKLFGAVHRNRSDLALVRVVVPQDPLATEESGRSAIAFVTAIYPALSSYFPQ